MVFSSQNSTYSVLPFIDVGCLYAEDYGTPSKQLFVKLNVAGEALTIYRTKDVVDYIIQCSTLKNPFGLYEFTQKADLVTKLLMFENSKDLIPESASKVIKPLKTDPGLVLGNKMSKWRTPEYELYEWNRFEGVLFFDTIDYEVQADFFRRLAFFAEKIGFRGFILTDVQLGNMHGYHAHDYSAETLAAFFTKAMDMKIKLLASCKRSGEKLCAIVAPHLVAKSHPLYNIEDVFNAIFVKGNMLGDSMFYGSGAGKLPTASAVVGDIVEAAKNGPFLSKDDFRQRTKATKTVIDLMGDLGLLGDMPESNQLSLFDFA